jgi:hypothetical protein
MSDFELNPAKADSLAADDVRETESSPPAGTEEPAERADSLSMFPSEASESEATDRSSPDPADVTSGARASQEQTVAGTQNPRSRRWYSEPVAIADDRAQLEAPWNPGTYVETEATLQAVCTRIERRLIQVEEALARTEGFVADGTLHELSTRIAARLAATEDALRHIETVVTNGPPDELLALQTLGADIDRRLAHVEDALGRTEGLVADRTLHEMSAHIAARLTETEGAVRRIEGLVASGPPEELFALQALGATIDKRLAHVEDALGRTEGLVTDRTLHVMSAHIAARLTETEGAVRRIEGLVASRAVAELSARVDAAFAHTDDALRRIEAALASSQHHDRAADAAGWSRRLSAAAALTGTLALESLNGGSQAAWSGADCQTRRSGSRTGRRADLCRFNASSHQRRSTTPTPTPTRRTTARRDCRRTGGARAGSTGKSHPTNKPVDAADDTWSFRSGTEAQRRCPDNGERDGSSRRACPICGRSFDYLETTG